MEKEEEDYLKENVNIYINLYSNEKLRKNIYSKSKSLCEGTQIISALQYIINNNIEYKHLYKISGRYTLSKQFNYDIFNCDKVIIKSIKNNMKNIFTALYKIPKKFIKPYYNFLISKNTNNKMNKCIGLEIIFAEWINSLSDNDIIYINPIGLTGYVSVCGSLFNG